MTIYALVQHDAIVQVGLPMNGVWNDGERDWDLRGMSDPELAALGWLPVVETPRPPDTDTTTFDLTYGLVSGQPTEVWTARPWTPPEQQARTEAKNRDTLMADIEANIATLKGEIDKLNVIINTANSTINASPAAYIKDTARSAKSIAHNTVRIAKVIVNDLEDTHTGAP